MAKKIILEVTERQLQAISFLMQSAEAMIGCSEDDGDKLTITELKLAQRIFTKNGYESPIN